MQGGAIGRDRKKEEDKWEKWSSSVETAWVRYLNDGYKPTKNDLGRGGCKIVKVQPKKNRTNLKLTIRTKMAERRMKA